MLKVAFTHRCRSPESVSQSEPLVTVDPGRQGWWPLVARVAHPASLAYVTCLSCGWQCCPSLGRSRALSFTECPPFSKETRPASTVLRSHPTRPFPAHLGQVSECVGLVVQLPLLNLHTPEPGDRWMGRVRWLLH